VKGKNGGEKGESEGLVKKNLDLKEGRGGCIKKKRM